MLYVITREGGRERPEYNVSIECFCTCMLYVITRVGERERPEYNVSIECFCTCMLYVLTREGERERETRIYCQYRVFLYMHFVRHNERDRPEYTIGAVSL